MWMIIKCALAHCSATLFIFCVIIVELTYICVLKIKLGWKLALALAFYVYRSSFFALLSGNYEVPTSSYPHRLKLIINSPTNSSVPFRSIRTTLAHPHYKSVNSALAPAQREKSPANPNTKTD